MSAFLPANRMAFTTGERGLGGARGWVLGTLVAGPAVLAACSALTGSIDRSGPSPALLPSAGPGEARRASLEFRGATAERRLGFLTVVGAVANVTSRPIHNVVAVVEFLDPRGRLVALQTGPVEMSVVQPGDQSPFQIEARDDPAVASFRVRFRTLLGAPLPVRDVAGS